MNALQNTSLRLIMVLGLSLISTTSLSLTGSRTGLWQISLVPSYTSSQVVTFDGGATADINSRSGFAIGIGYNFSDHMELDLDFGTADGNYTGTRVPDDSSSLPETFSSNMFASHINLGLTYNFSASRLTPFVRGNLGWTYVDSGVPTGRVGTGCWWDPWYGYICAPIAETYTANEFTYGADLGLRFDVTRTVFLKGSAGKSYFDFDRSSSTGFTVYKFVIGFGFR